MRINRLLCALALIAFVSNAWADDLPSPEPQSEVDQVAQNDAANGQQPTAHPSAITYSHGYELRAKIHKYASFATLPLFATELALGQSLYDGTGTEGKKGVHAAIGSGIVGLFGLNTVTGVWNMWEARQDPNGKSKRMVHGVLMLVANAGFVAASATGPSHGRNGALTFEQDRVTHRNIAVVSIGVATAGYLMMLIHH